MVDYHPLQLLLLSACRSQSGKGSGRTDGTINVQWPSHRHVGVFKESIAIFLYDCAQHWDINGCFEANLRPVCTSTCQMLEGLWQPTVRVMGTLVGHSPVAPLL